METSDFYSDRKYCPDCEQYVPYLCSLDNSYCAICGRAVRLFSKTDWDRFHDSIQERKPKGGRPRKGQFDRIDRESA
jgi:hypothetical protein